jgi:type IV secretion system protein VirD4
MTRPQAPPRRDGSDDTIFLLVVGAVATATGGHWLVGNLAALVGRGRLLRAGLGEALGALTRLPSHPGEPRLAWDEPARSNLPGPVIYWLAVVLVVLPTLTLATVLMQRLGSHRHEPPDKRRRLGVETQARLATTRDLRPLITRRPEPGRFVLAPWGRRLLSTETAAATRGRRGVRGAVAVFGPSQSGKTTGLIEGVRAWAGPAIVSSVKTDLLRATVQHRGQRGEIKVFDPLGVTGTPSASWSPLRAASDLAGALAAAQVLARTGAEEAPSDRFWRGQAEQLIAAMLWTAANTEGHTMRNVVRWVLELDRPQGDAAGTLAPLVRLLTDHPDPATALAAQQVQGWLLGQWSTDPRTTSSVYATARNAVWPWADPAIAATAEGCDITLDWLFADANTLYLSAPLGDETRIGVVFAVLLHDLITQAFHRYNRTGEALDPKLLVLLDEAANTPLPKLPQWASTVTGAGIQLVTVWQSKAQLDRIYSKDAETVLTNHRSKLIYPSGITDLATVQYISELVGEEHIRSDLDDHRWNVPPEQRLPGRSPATALAFLPASVLRRAAIGDALLLHGHLPPAWIRATASRRRGLRGSVRAYRGLGASW